MTGDDLFVAGGIQWRRTWEPGEQHPSAGCYLWQAARHGRHLAAWREGHVYRASVGGVVARRTWRTLLEAMAAAANEASRQKWEAA